MVTALAQCLHCTTVISSARGQVAGKIRSGFRVFCEESRHFVATLIFPELPQLQLVDPGVASASTTVETADALDCASPVEMRQRWRLRMGRTLRESSTGKEDTTFFGNATDRIGCVAAKATRTMFVIVLKASFFVYFL